MEINEKNPEENIASQADEKLKDAAKNLAHQAEKWESAAKEQAANAANAFAGTADKLADVAKEQVANATNVLAGLADKFLDALSSASDNNEEKETEKDTLTEKEDAAVSIEQLSEESVDFETFSRCDIRVVKVKDCFAVPKSKKLLQFTLDDGSGTDRTILSGIHAFYEPEQLVGKTLVAITNLPPRNMMGVDSCGMLLSAVHNVCGEEKLNLIMVSDDIPAGAKLY